MLKGLRVGAQVNYVLKQSDFPGAQSNVEGQVRPAIVVNDWPLLNRDDGYCNLQVYTDGRNDGLESGLSWATSRLYSATREPGTWHWPTDPPTPFDGLPATAENKETTA